MPLCRRAKDTQIVGDEGMMSFGGTEAKQTAKPGQVQGMMSQIQASMRSVGDEMFKPAGSAALRTGGSYLRPPMTPRPHGAQRLEDCLCVCSPNNIMRC